MQFLKTLFLVVLTVGLFLFASVNWFPVTLTLWGGLQADVVLPALLLFVFLLGFVPMFLIHKSRTWGLRRRLEAQDRITVVNPPPPQAEPSESREDRIATDSKLWPAP